MQRKKIIGRLLFASWVVLFLVHYVVGSNGLLYGWRLSGENNALVSEIGALESEIKQLRHEIDQWKSEPFFKERYARQQLQLARPEQTVYYLEQKA